MAITLRCSNPELSRILTDIWNNEPALAANLTKAWATDPKLAKVFIAAWNGDPEVARIVTKIVKKIATAENAARDCKETIANIKDLAYAIRAEDEAQIDERISEMQEGIKNSILAAVARTSSKTGRSAISSDEFIELADIEPKVACYSAILQGFARNDFGFFARLLDYYRRTGRITPKQENWVINEALKHLGNGVLRENAIDMVYNPEQEDSVPFLMPLFTMGLNYDIEPEQSAPLPVFVPLYKDHQSQRN